MTQVGSIPAVARKAFLPVAVLAAYISLPILVQGDLALSILCSAGIVAVGAIGLNLLTGYAGQVSLGHAFFLGIGAYAGASLGDDLGWSVALWLPAAAIVGAAAGALIGPLALRLRGGYLIIVTLGLVYVGMYLFETATPVTGGLSGRSVTANNTVGPLDFTHLMFGGERFSRNQGMFWLIWIVVIAVALLARNITRGRVGRGLKAVRDREAVASAAGVSVATYKVRVFAVSSALGAMAGALQASYLQFLEPSQWNLGVSIQYITVIIIGGMGSIGGTVTGAVVVGAMPVLIQRYSASLPFLAASAPASGPALTAPVFNRLLYGLLIIGFLLFEPRGLSAVSARVRDAVSRAVSKITPTNQQTEGDHARF